MTAVDSHAHPQRRRQWPRFECDRALRRDGRVDAVRRRREDRVSAVAGLLHHVPAVRHDRVPQDLVVARERGSHLARLLLPEAGRAFDVGEQEGDRSGR